VRTVDSTTTAGTNWQVEWLSPPPPQETCTHDADGNLTGDARWTYTWDAENQLVAMEERTFTLRPALNPATGKLDDGNLVNYRVPTRLRLEFIYDWQHRRVAKKVFRDLGAGQALRLAAYTVFVYDGWNLVAEVDALDRGAPRRSYLWGNDLSTTLTGAGGSWRGGRPAAGEALAEEVCEHRQREGAGREHLLPGAE
jgi:hypothetical protein